MRAKLGREVLADRRGRFDRRGLLVVGGYGEGLGKLEVRMHVRSACGPLRTEGWDALPGRQRWRGRGFRRGSIMSCPGAEEPAHSRAAGNEWR